MSLIDSYVHSDSIDPIDLVETLAEAQSWEFDRVAEDQIAMAVDGQWRTYSVTLAWSPRDETLRLISTFELKPPQDRLSALHETLNRANDECWLGAFTYWEETGLVVYRYALSLAGGQVAVPAQIDRMIHEAVTQGERFYPAMQLACWGNRTPRDAMQIAIADAYGHA